MLMVELTDSVKYIPDPDAIDFDTRGVQWYREGAEGALLPIDGDPYDWDPLTDPRGYPFTPVARGTYAAREFLTNAEGTVWDDYVYFVAFNPEDAQPAVVEAPILSGLSTPPKVGELLVVTTRATIAGTPTPTLVELGIERKLAEDDDSEAELVVADEDYLFRFFEEWENELGTVRAVSEWTDPVAAAGAAQGSLAFPDDPVIFNPDSDAALTLVDGRISEMRNQNYLAGSFWSPPSAPRNPARPTLPNGLRTLHLDNTGSSACILTYPARTLAYDGGTVSMDAAGADLWTHSICFRPLVIDQLRYIVAISNGLATARLYQLLFNSTGSLRLRLRMDNDAADEAEFGFTDLGVTLEVGTDYAVTLRKSAADTVHAFVASGKMVDGTPVVDLGPGAGVACNVGGLTGTLPSVTYMANRTVASGGFQGYVHSFIARPESVTDEIATDRNKRLLRRAGVVIP
jgi:hypothetical protein